MIIWKGMKRRTGNTKDSNPGPKGPFEFYLNGVQMPKYTGAIHELVNWYDLLNGLKDDWHAELTYHNLWIWICKWDSSVGRVRSLEATKFVILCQELIKTIDLNRSRIENDLRTKHLKLSGSVAREVTKGIFQGLLKAREIALGSEVCFWVRGREEDNSELKEVMRRTFLPPEHSEFLEFPHLVERRSELATICKVQEQQLAQAGILIL
jgi:hypothetical protein